LPPPEFLPRLRELCDQHHTLLIFDEIYTGLGRTGQWFASEHSGTVPDLVCLGKALTGGFPLSACVGRADLMDAAWPASTGEAIHTSTFLGHPVGCAMALAELAKAKAALSMRQRENTAYLVAQAWGVTAHAVRRNVLNLAGLDPNRWESPIHSFTDAERIAIRAAAQRAVRAYEGVLNAI